MRHSLRLYRERAIYSFIPKNACSTMRFSLAVANGCIAGEGDFNWIHANNKTFSADLESLLTAEYTFVILRCPFARIASAYLDKLVNRDGQLWTLRSHEQYAFEPDNLTFRRFVRLLQRPATRNLDIHWRPQVDFLVYEEYDSYFALEDFATAVRTLEERLGLAVLDARHLTRHGTDQFAALEDGCYADVAPDEILAAKRQGRCPSLRAMYDDETVALVRSCYAADLALYRSLFGEAALMFG